MAKMTKMAKMVKMAEMAEMAKTLEMAKGAGVWSWQTTQLAKSSAWWWQVRLWQHPSWPPRLEAIETIKTIKTMKTIETMQTMKLMMSWSIRLCVCVCVCVCVCSRQIMWTTHMERHWPPLETSFQYNNGSQLATVSPSCPVIQLPNSSTTPPLTPAPLPPLPPPPPREE